MVKKLLLFGFLAIFIPFLWGTPAIAGLPLGNRVKDPYAILRNALPVNQKELRELQHSLEDTSDDLKGNRWTAVSKAASRSNFIVSNRKQEILNAVPLEKRNEGEKFIAELKQDLELLNTQANEKNKDAFIATKRKSLEKIGALEALLTQEEFPYKIPSEFDHLPRLLGRASVSIKTSKGNMNAIIDGYNAPLTAGSFIDLTLKGFYDGLPINRAEEFFILQTGDPKGAEIGYIDSQTQEERHIPLEIRAPNRDEIFYNTTFEELGLYTETPVLPFATLGTLGWAHSDQALDDGSSQFFFFLYEAELNPAGRNLIDGRNAAFGYVVDGEDVLNNLGVDDEIISIKVTDGAERFKEHN